MGVGGLGVWGYKFMPNLDPRGGAIEKAIKGAPAIYAIERHD